MWAERLGGRFLLRIEDIDVGRTREEYVSGITEDLHWLGITWEEPVLRQSRRFDSYREAAELLQSQGLLYPCFATRAEIAEAARRRPGAVDPDGAPLYPGLHKHLRQSEISERLSRGEAFAMRLNMEKALARARELTGGAPLTYEALDSAGNASTVTAHPERWGDAIIVRKDTPTSYHLAVVIDDAFQRITCVTRGRDLEPATDLHRLLQTLLGLPAPLYHHHDLITDNEGRKLSKSAKDTSLAALRCAGATAADIRQQLAPYLPAAQAPFISR